MASRVEGGELTGSRGGRPGASLLSFPAEGGTSDGEGDGSFGHEEEREEGDGIERQEAGGARWRTWERGRSLARVRLGLDGLGVREGGGAAGP